MAIKIFESKILEAKNLGTHVKYLKYSLPRGFKFNAGQYFSMSYFVGEKKFRHPYSIATISGKRFGEFYIKLSKDSDSSKFIKKLKKGDKIELFGPLGKPILSKDSKKKDLFFITTGTGLTPFIGTIQELLKKGFKNKIIFLKGFNNEKEILCEKQFLALQKKYNNFEFHNILSKPKNRNFKDKGYVQDFLDKYIPENFDGHFYICGRKEMIKSATKKLEKSGIKKSKIFY